MLKVRAGMLAVSSATFLWLIYAAEARPPSGGGGGLPGGGGKPSAGGSFKPAPRVNVGGSSGAVPRIQSGNSSATAPRIQVGGAAGATPRVNGPGSATANPRVIVADSAVPQKVHSNVRPAIDSPGGKQVARGSVARPADGALYSWHNHLNGQDFHLRSTDLLLLGLCSPFGIYSGLAQGCLPGYSPWFAYHQRCSGARPAYFHGFLPEQQNYVPDAGGIEVPPEPPPVDRTDAMKSAVQGDRDFATGLYSAAVQSWKQALAADPRNPRIVLRLSQGLFQTGNFQEAAGAAQLVLSVVAPEEWSAVVPSFVDLYQDNIFDYSSRLRELEKARLQKADDASLRFLLGYHYAFLGFADEAVRELAEVRKLAPQDEVARKLLEMVEAKRGKS